MKPIDRIGQRFGALTVIERDVRMHDKARSALWVCLCDCGTKKTVSADRLVRGRVTSCGCRRHVGDLKATHGLTRAGNKPPPEYGVWSMMKDRCSNPNNDSYADYGARGIAVCVEWQNDFTAFMRDMGPRPSPKHSIDRKNNDLGYTADNCRWATSVEQANNRRPRGPNKRPYVRGRKAA